MKVSFQKKDPGTDFFLKRSGWLFLAKLIPTLTFLLVTIIYSRQLSHDAYGIFQSVWMLTNVSVVLVGFGSYSVLLSSGLHSLILLVKRNPLKISAFFLLLFVIATVFIFSSLSSESSSLILLVLCIVLIHVSGFIYESLLIRSGKEIFIFLMNLLYAILYFGWHLYILNTKFDIVHLVAGVAVLGIIRLLGYIILANAVGKEKSNGIINLQHWFIIGLNEVIGVVAKWLDKLLLVYFLTPSEFAIFFNGSFEIPLFGILVSVIGSILLVEVSFKLAQKEKVIQTFRETFLLLSNIVFPLFWFLFFFGEEIFHVIFNNRYNDSIPIFMLAILIIPVRITHYSSILQCYNKAPLILKGSLLDILIAVASMPVLYFMMGIKGVALAIVISTYIQSLYYLHYSARVLQTSISAIVPVKSLMLRFLLFALLIGVLHFFLQKEKQLAILIYAMAFVSFIILCSLYLHFKKNHLQLGHLVTKTGKRV